MTSPPLSTHSASTRGKVLLNSLQVHRGTLLFIIVVGVLLRFAALGRQPLWLDEATDASFAARSFWNCVFAENIHPPLYRVLLHFVVLGFGDSAVSVRFLPALFGVLAIAAMAILARRILPKSELAIAALVATSPFLIYYSQENRNYSLFVLLALLSTWAFWRFRDENRGLWLYTAFSILLLYTHHLAFFVLLAHEIVYWVHVRERVRDWLIARSIVIAALTPWIFWVARGYHSEARLFLSPLSLVPIALLRFCLGYGVNVADTARIAQSAYTKFMQEAPVLVPSLCVYAWLVWRGIRYTRLSQDLKTFLAAIIFIPWLVLVLLAPWVQLAHERYLVFQAPFILLLVAAGLLTLRGRARWSACLALSLVVGFSLAAYYDAPGSAFGYRFRYAKENWAGATDFIRQNHVNAVILAPGFLRLPFDRYSRGDAREILADSSAVPDVRAGERVALVLSHTSPAQDDLRATMDATYGRVAQMDFTSQNLIRVIVYDTSQNLQAR